MNSFLGILMIALAGRAAETARAPEPSDTMPRMEIIEHMIRYGPACSPRLGVEVAESLFVPAKTPKGLRYRLAFYVVRGTEADTQRLSSVAAVAEADPDGRNVDCSIKLKLPKGEETRVMGGEVTTPQLRKLSHAEAELRKRRHYELLPPIAAAFVAGKKDEQTRALAQEFSDLHDLLSEPSLGSYYAAMSPEFWRWLKRAKDVKKP